MRVVLTRGASTSYGVQGVIRVGTQSWFTIERPWLENRSNVSCFPKGIYPVHQTFSPRFKRMLYELFGVPGRFACRIHPANLASQLNGCISLGKKKGTMNGVPCVLLSRPAVSEFEAALDRQPFTLEVV